MSAARSPPQHRTRAAAVSRSTGFRPWRRPINGRSLRLLEKGGIIKICASRSDFLYACDKQGMRIEVAFYVADFVWEECSDGRTVIGDVKPKKGVDPLRH